MAISTALIELLEGKTVASSRLSQSLINELIGESLIIPIVRGSRKSYKARNLAALRQWLIDRDESYRILEHSQVSTRAAQASATGNSKIVTVRSCPGFPVNTYEPITCSLNGEPITIQPQEGTFLFITHWQEFNVPSDVVIVGIENMENFRCIRQQRTLFTSMLPGEQLLFVSRYPQSTDLRSWLQSVPNRYIHFGDFDLAGINIFITEFYNFLGERALFLIPNDIEERLMAGSCERYDAQLDRFQNLTSSCPSLQKLITLIHHHRRCYDQEGYILV